MKADVSELALQKAHHWANTRGDAIYMVQPLAGGIIVEYTWAETVYKAKCMAAHLKTYDFPKASKIAILSKNCAEFIIADLAIWMAGFTSVAIYPTSTADTVSYILQHSESKLLFVGKLDSWNSMKPGVPENIACIAFDSAPENAYEQWQSIITNTEPMEGEPIRDATDIAILIYTSGSTCVPKGAEFDFNAIAIPGPGAKKMFQTSTEDRLFSYLPLAHVYERTVVEMNSIYNGSKIFFAESLETFGQDLQRAKPTLFHSVPRLWLKFQMGVFSKMSPAKLNFLLKIPLLNKVIKNKILTGLGLDQCRYAISASAPIPPDLIDWYRKLGLELLEGYGMTENFAYSHASVPGKTRVGYVGNTYPGVKHRISEEGEILVYSPASMRGYYKLDAKTAESFTEDGYLKTGDRGEIDENGCLKITGRTKELFKTSKGKYVAPSPIENLFNINPYVEQCCVAGSGEVACHVLVMLGEDFRLNLNKGELRQKIDKAMTELLVAVNEQIEHHEKIQFITIVKDEWNIENEFLTPTMKIKRNILEEYYAPKLANWYESKQSVNWES